MRQRPDPHKSLVGFIVGDGAYAVPINYVREIINPVPLTELPRAPATVAGVVDHRDEVVVVLSLRAHLGIEEQPVPRSTREKWILLRTEEGSIGLIVDQVTEVFGTAGEQLKPAPRVRGAETRGFMGVFTRSGVLTFVLDVRVFEEVARSYRGDLVASFPATTSPAQGVESELGGNR